MVTLLNGALSSSLDEGEADNGEDERGLDATGSMQMGGYVVEANNGMWVASRIGVPRPWCGVHPPPKRANGVEGE